jgi:tetratricopeptide (TPR) repeat protein
MDFHNSSDMELLITRSLREILRHEDFHMFLTWMHHEVGVTPQLSLLPEPQENLGPMATWLALTLWNATPLPGNNFRPMPVATPGRNQKCICGSGRKFKRCCSIGEHAHPPIDEDMIWPLIFDTIPKRTLNRALKEGLLPLKARIFYSEECLESDKPDRVLHLLQGYYFSSSWKDTGKLAAYGLNLLFEALDCLGNSTRKMELIDHICTNAPSSPLRSEALQRLATIQADAGNLSAAFASLEKAQKDTPRNPSVAMLEVQLLLVRGDLNLARQRARFIAGQINRQNTEADPLFPDLMLDFLESVVENPEAVAASLASGPGPDDSWLEAFIDDHWDRQPVACDFEELENFAEDDEFNPAPDRSHFMVISPPELQDVENGWRDVCPVAPLFGVQLFPSDECDPWQDEDLASWKDFLLDHPEALDSIPIIDDLLTLCTMHPDWMHPDMMDSLFEPILDRGIDLVEKSLEQLDNKGCLPWLVTENRPLLRILVRDIVDAYTENDISEALKCSRQVMELNPWDNHGLRRDIVNIHLQNGEDAEALALIEKFPDDLMTDIIYGRVLALYRLGRKDEAEAAARKAKQRFPRVASYLVAPQRTDPNEDSPFGIISGSKQEAWEYRQEMRSTWKASRGILTWLKKI